jgi:hypothetical protein
MEEWRPSLQTRLRRRRRALGVLIGSCLVMIPWIVYLALSLPEDYVAEQWRYAWVGFDVGLLAALAATAWFAWRGRQMVIPLAITTAVLLACDAWFDVMLDWGTPDVWFSAASAVLVELPFAALLLLHAHRLLTISLRLAWTRSGIEGDFPPLRHVPLFPVQFPDE